MEEHSKTPDGKGVDEAKGSRFLWLLLFWVCYYIIREQRQCRAPRCLTAGAPNTAAAAPPAAGQRSGPHWLAAPPHAAPARAGCAHGLLRLLRITACTSSSTPSISASRASAESPVAAAVG